MAVDSVSGFEDAFDAESRSEPTDEIAQAAAPEATSWMRRLGDIKHGKPSPVDAVEYL